MISSLSPGPPLPGGPEEPSAPNDVMTLRQLLFSAFQPYISCIRRGFDSLEHWDPALGWAQAGRSLLGRLSVYSMLMRSRSLWQCWCVLCGYWLDDGSEYSESEGVSSCWNRMNARIIPISSNWSLNSVIRFHVPYEWISVCAWNPLCQPARSSFSYDIRQTFLIWLLSQVAFIIILV